MLIRIMYTNGRFDFVKPGLLDRLIDQERLATFKRQGGWAVIGRDPLRGGQDPDYPGPERRTS